MAWKKGAEFIAVRGAYIAVADGKGTHVWNGSKIVPKPKKKTKKGDKTSESE